MTDTSNVTQQALLAVRKLKRKLEALEYARREPIAIVSMACRFPGGSTPEQFWATLIAGEDQVRAIPDERTIGPWPAGVPRWAGLIDDVQSFDPGFFGISPREALSLDPQQRLVLELAWETLERARLIPATLEASNTGVFLGMCSADYSHRVDLRAEPDRDTYDLTGNLPSTAAGRVAYVFGFEGPAITVDTACSSSLVTLHLACQSLRAGDSDLALAGGVNLILSERISAALARTQALSPDGRCRTFDASANGFVRGEGCGLVLLQRLSDAQRDGNPILAVIRGSAVNQDGRSTGLTAPNVLAQQRLLRAALTNAGVEPHELGYLECHGTGTALGDPIEVHAIQAVFGPDRDRSPLWLGALKSNIGHLEGAAGVASVQKVVLALQHGRIPANLHLRRPNPRTNLAAPLAPVTEIVDWAPIDDRRLAGVSSFGLSGTNAHLILESAPPPRSEPSPTGDSPVPTAVPILISARSPAGLRGQASALLEHLDAHPSIGLLDLATSLALDRTHFEHRACAVVPDLASLRASLHAIAEAQPGPTHVEAQTKPASKLVFVFPGQGSQWPGMARALLDQSPTFRASIDACALALAPHIDWSLLATLRDEPHAASLDRVDVIQPVLFAIMVSLAAVWREWGVVPSAVLGLSQGEIAAAHVCGALSLDDAAKIVAVRSRLIAAKLGPGAMASISLASAELEPLLAQYGSRLAIAVDNGPASVAVSGDLDAVDQLLADLTARGVFARKIQVDYASHCAHVDALCDVLHTALADIRPQPAHTPMLSTTTVAPLDGPELGADYWFVNLRQRVRFAEATRALMDRGHRSLVEVSPHPVASLAIEALLTHANVPGVVVGSLRRERGDLGQFLISLAELHCNGVAVDWAAAFAKLGGRHVPLPTYAFQRSRYWLDAPAQAGREPLPPWFYQVRWDPTETPHAEPRLLGHWLVLTPNSDAGPTSAAVVAHLRAVADGVTVLALPPNSTRDTIARSLASQSTPCIGVVSLLGLAPGLSTDLSAFTATLTLVQAVGDQPRPPRLWIVTESAVTTRPSDRLHHPMQALLWGLGRTISLEHPELWGGLIDLAGPQTTALLPSVLNLDDEHEVAIRDARIYVRRLDRAPVVPPLSPLELSGTALITGGTGGLGRHVATWLVERGVKQLILTSRRGLGSPGADILQHDLERAGASVRVIACDVGERESVASLFDELEADAWLPNIVIHTAGVLGPLNELEHLTADQATAVLRGKVLGAVHLHELTEHRTLDLFINFASASGVWGSGRLAPYSAANAFLDALARHRADLGLPALSIAWGVWEQSGMSTFAEAELLTPMPTKTALDAMEAALAMRAVDLVIADVDWSTFVPLFNARRRRPLLDWLAELEPRSTEQPIFDLPPTERLAALCTKLVDVAAQVLHLHPTAIDRDRPLPGYGLDSLMAVELGTRLRNTGITVPVASLLRGYSLRQLADEYLGSLSATTGPTAWVVVEESKPRADHRLVCFPYGGGGPAVFKRWSAEIGGAIEIAVVHLPGRGSRLDEPAADTLAPSVAAIVDALLPLADRPLSLFGHCLGAILMFEVASVLEHQHDIRLHHVFVSAAAPPHQYQCPPMRNAGEARLLSLLSLVGFANTKALEDPQVRALVLPAVLADFTAACEYSRTPDLPAPVSSPITAIAGLHDLFMSPEFTPGWKAYTTQQLHLHLLDDHHYFLETRHDQVVDLVHNTILAHASSTLSTLTPMQWQERMLVHVSAGSDFDARSVQRIEHRLVADAHGTIVLLPDVLASFPLASVVSLDAAWSVVELRYQDCDASDLVSLANALADVLGPVPTPIILVGVGFGAVCAAHIAAHRPTGIDHLVVLNAAPPHHYAMPRLFDAPDPDLLGFLAACGHPDPTPAQVAPLRQGLRLASRFPATPPPALSIPITVLRANFDMVARGYHTMRCWDDLTPHAVSLMDYEGDHFSNVDAILASALADIVDRV